MLFISFKSAIYSEVEKCGKQKSAKAEEWLKSGRRVASQKSDKAEEWQKSAKSEECQGRRVAR